MFNGPYAEYYDILNKKKDYQSEIEFVHRWAKCPKKILDIGCGTASYWKYFPKDTLLTGVEQSSEMIKRSPYKEKILCLDAMVKHDWQVKYDTATMLFHVVNYIPVHYWWKDLPIKRRGGFLVFDVLDKEEADRWGFKVTVRKENGIKRYIIPNNYDGKKVELKIYVSGKDFEATELHTLYLFDRSDIEKFAGSEFEIVEVRKTITWQTWWKLRRK